jgi:hypothetical protein
MSDAAPAEKPLWLRDRDTVIAHDEGVVWRKGRPDYHLTNQIVHKERTKHLLLGSLEQAVEDLVRVFEMEVSHKRDPAQWLTIVQDKFRTRTNGGEWATPKDIAERGSYNLFIGEAQHYSAKNETFESSSEIFHTAFPGGFFWEVLEVYSPPPVVSFKWRHWGHFTGEYKGHAPTGKKVEIFGMTVARCAEDLRLIEVEHFYDNSLFLGQLVTGAQATGSGCPVHQAAK